MLQREKISADWKTWEPQRLAYALEAHLIPKDKWALRGVPRELQKQVLEDPFTGVGYHFRTGWFMLACGQGPAPVFVEKLDG